MKILEVKLATQAWLPNKPLMMTARVELLDASIVTCELGPAAVSRLMAPIRAEVSQALQKAAAQSAGAA